MPVHATPVTVSHSVKPSMVSHLAGAWGCEFEPLVMHNKQANGYSNIYFVHKKHMAEIFLIYEILISHGPSNSADRPSCIFHLSSSSSIFSSSSPFTLSKMPSPDLLLYSSYDYGIFFLCDGI